LLDTVYLLSQHCTNKQLIMSSTLELVNERIEELYSSGDIDGIDVAEVSQIINLSKFTVFQYANGNGKSVSTAESILREFIKICNRRKRLSTQDEIISEDLNND